MRTHLSFIPFASICMVQPANSSDYPHSDPRHNAVEDSERFGKLHNSKGTFHAHGQRIMTAQKNTTSSFNRWLEKQWHKFRKNSIYQQTRIIVVAIYLFSMALSFGFLYHQPSQFQVSYAQITLPLSHRTVIWVVNTSDENFTHLEVKVETGHKTDEGKPFTERWTGTIAKLYSDNRIQLTAVDLSQNGTRFPEEDFYPTLITLFQDGTPIHEEIPSLKRNNP